ncbi:MAG TPA: hypothetical protein VHN37_13125 [Actinomycetota bacterium]|nr:hypothetical protein [Actinomycetota bacterium]
MRSLAIVSHSPKRVIKLAAGVVVGTTLALLLQTAFFSNPVQHVHGVEPETAISADFWYDVSDPSLIAGDSFYVVVGRVVRTVRVDGDRTVFEVAVTKELKGSTPDSVLVSQLGKVEGEHSWELEDFPLMKEGHQYVMSVVPPSVHEPSDALILLSAKGMGNKVEVTGPDDPLVSWYADKVRKARTPYPAGASGHRERAASGRQWQETHPGYGSPGLSPAV